MEPLLVAVTFISLALASFMTLLAWKLLREKQDRTAARAEALAAMAFTAVPSGAHPDANADADVDDWDDALGTSVPAQPHALRLSPLDEAALDAPALVPADGLFSATATPRPGSRLWLALAAVALLMLAGGVTAYALRTPEVMAAVNASRGDSAIASKVAALTGDAPLELLVLRHAVDPQGDFTVTGVVQNPITGPTREDVAAVVNLFDDEGRHVATGRALLSGGRISPGQEVRFEIRLPHATAVSRYLVGFRRDADNVVVSHVDHRDRTSPASDDTSADAPATHDAPEPPVSLSRHSEG